MDNIPKIDWQYLNKIFDKSILSRGDDYFSQGLVFKAIKRGNGLYSFCRSTEIYRQICLFENGNINFLHCTCPALYPCKHLAALLIAWKNNREQFQDKLTIKELLSNISTEELKEFFINLSKMPKFSDTIYALLEGEPLPDNEEVQEEDYEEYE